MPIKENKKAPPFTGFDQNGKMISLSDFAGKKLILFFYPKDDTPTCTTEACNLSDNYKNLRNKGFEIAGVSADSIKQHNKFATKHDFDFSLIADTERKIINAYKVWGEKMLFGKTYMGIIRTTFIIDEQGVIEKVFEKIDAENHTQQILKSYTKK